MSIDIGIAAIDIIVGSNRAEEYFIIVRKAPKCPMRKMHEHKV